MRRHFRRGGRLRFVAGAAYSAVVAQELLLERAIDALAPAREVGHPLLGEATALVKTFERPQVLRRLVASIRRLYPALRVLVVDDSRAPVRLDGVETIVMPYDSGITIGRNEGLRHVTTKYVLLLDDDFVFFRRTRLGHALELMEENDRIDIMGGKVIDLPFFNVRPAPHEFGAILPTDASPVAPIGSAIGGLAVCAKVPNFFVARRDRLALVPWDSELKLGEHAEFFTRALGVLTTVFNPHFECLHAQTPFDDEYMSKRLRSFASEQILAERYGRP